MGPYLWVSLGAIAGANLRFAVSGWAAKAWPAFPVGTLLVNCSGSLLLGAFLAWAVNRPGAEHWRLLLGVGFCGAYTTFSAYSRETIELAEAGRWLHAALNVLANNLLALAAVAAGFLLARTFSSP